MYLPAMTCIVSKMERTASGHCTQTKLVLLDHQNYLFAKSWKNKTELILNLSLILKVYVHFLSS